MNPQVRHRYLLRARVMKAMAHPVRLLLVDELSKQERCVRELTAMAGQDISTVSKHLAVLKKTGIVADEKRGAQVFYTLRCRCATRFFTCVEDVLNSR